MFEIYVVDVEIEELLAIQVVWTCDASVVVSSVLVVGQSTSRHGSQTPSARLVALCCCTW